MADQLILLDTSILIDYYRKSDNSNSVWVALIAQEYEF
jgi:predicted nucleic acid-binding protein